MGPLDWVKKEGQPLIKRKHDTRWLQNTPPKGAASDPQFRLLDLQRCGYSLPRRLAEMGAGFFHTSKVGKYRRMHRQHPGISLTYRITKDAIQMPTIATMPRNMARKEYLAILSDGMTATKMNRARQAMAKTFR